MPAEIPRLLRPGACYIVALLVLVTLGVVGQVGIRRFVLAANHVRPVGYAELRLLADALDLFRLAYRRYPTNQEGLAILLRPVGNGTEPLLENIPQDPWGNSYEYSQPVGVIDLGRTLHSRGPDAIAGTSDDIPLSRALEPGVSNATVLMLHGIHGAILFVCLLLFYLLCRRPRLSRASG